MRQAEKQKALEFIETLYQAQEEIRNQIEQNHIESALGLLADCQEGAIQLGKLIEEAEGEGFVTIEYIEEYCELLYRIYQELQQENTINKNKIYKVLRGRILKIENSIKNDIASRLEIVFLPYKVSMWDSLESVWKAADADDQCDAYVIPIPYYDKNPDGSFRELHYEGGDYPDYVPTMWYKDYDFEKRRPDAIFIHNPYDDCNYVTSVHPFFYSYNLKKFTDCLVYIPYYISAESNADVPSDIKSGFVLTNGVVNSDIVIVQSENTKQLFVNILEKGIPGTKRDDWENKIYGLGSPKLDRVNVTDRDDARLPEDWKKIIYTEANIRKKVIMYNISLSPLLQNPDMMNKIKDTLLFFKQSQDAVLWWRPHPLYESTLASMRQDLLREYRTIVNQYRQERWGIFDDGVDLEWAIAETDAYYGDRSSVVQLYSEAKKPIMIQNVFVGEADNSEKSEDIPIWPCAFCVDKDDIWFVHGKMNVLMKYCIREGRTYVIGIVPGEKIFQESLYTGIYKWNNKIYLIPGWAREIAVYDIKENKFEKIQIKQIEAYQEKGLFGKVYGKNEYLYCIPCFYQAIIKINMESGCMEYVALKENQGLYINDSTIIDNTIFAVYSGTNRIVAYDIELDTVSIIKLGNSERKFTNLASIGKDLVAFDEKTQSVVRVWGDQYCNEKEFYRTFYKAVKLINISHSFILLDSVYDHEMQIISKEKNVIFKNRENERKKKKGLCSVYYSGIENSQGKEGEGLFYFSRDTYVMQQFSDERLEKQFLLTLEKCEFDKLESLISGIEEAEVIENDLYKLKNWITNLQEKKNDKKEIRKSCGEKILWAVKEKMHDKC